jgi:hypothetical protein
MSPANAAASTVTSPASIAFISITSSLNLGVHIGIVLLNVKTHIHIAFRTRKLSRQLARRAASTPAHVAHSATTALLVTRTRKQYLEARAPKSLLVVAGDLKPRTLLRNLVVDPRHYTFRVLAFRKLTIRDLSQRQRVFRRILAPSIR